MRGWWIVGLALVGCRSETELGRSLPDFGPPNPREVRTPTHTDRVVQVTIPLVDALFVVDNSCSMDAEQQALTGNFPGFLQWFLGSGLDYHIGVVSTDMKDPEHAGKLQERGGRRWIDQDTESPEGIFASMAAMGTDGDGSERGRAAAYAAVEILADGFNQGFVRGDAGLHITVISDENDASDDSPIPRSEFIDYLNTARWSQRMVSFSSIVGPLTGCPDIGEPGTEYLAVTAAVGGVTWPICTDDWSSVLDELGLLATGLSREFFLSRVPVPGTIEVSVEDQGVVRPFSEGADWTYDLERNSVTFTSFTPSPLSVVTIDYLVLAGLEEEDRPEEPPSTE